MKHISHLSVFLNVNNYSIFKNYRIFLSLCLVSKTIFNGKDSESDTGL